MPSADRKPLAHVPPMESRDTKTVRYKPSEIEAFAEAARRAGLGITTYMREATLTGHRFLQTQRLMEGDTRVTA